jgi:primosomal protein N' (replication factor Y)
MTGRYVEVAVPLPVTGTFTYSLPEELEHRAAVGARVLVPFGRRKLTGFVVGRSDETELEDVKDVIEVLDVEPLIDDRMLELTKWVADYYLAPWGEVLKAALPPGINMESRRLVRITREGTDALADGAGDLSERRRRIIEILAGRERASVAHVVREAGLPRGSTADIDALVRAGLVDLFEEVRRPRTEGGREQIVRLLVVKEEAAVQAEKLERRAPKQAAALRLLAQSPDGALAVPMLSQSGVASAVVTRLVERGLVERADREKMKLSVGLEGWALREEGDLTEEQTRAIDLIGATLSSGEFGVVLLHGVTGSGKTRVYAEAVARAAEADRGAIVLVPEIALTPQMVQRMRKEFGDRVAVIHSGLTLAERYDTWRAVREGMFSIVVGPRSAVFAPIRNVGVIVVDEEHEHTYKQSESPRYHARDVAAVRGRLERAVVVLGSATPSVESYLNAAEGKYGLVELPSRIDAGPLPEVEIVDMREEPPVDSEGAFSRRLAVAVGEVLDDGKQVILFLNRRGYASFVQCLSCGHSIRCGQCNVSLTYHATGKRMLCHYCGVSAAAPESCPECGGHNMRFGAPGTQRVERAVRELFPEATVARMDQDTTGRHGSHWRILKEFAERKTDILLGTQMIAKGLDFPGVGLVGVVAADVGLNLPDFRAGERTFQLLTQVAGRTGRGEERGRVIVQTYVPEHYTIALAQAQSYTPFFDREVSERRGVGLGYPPYSRLVSIVVRGRGESAVAQAASRLASFLEQGAAKMDEPRPEVLGPAPAPIERIKGTYRWHIIVRGKGGSARALVAAALAQRPSLELPRAVALSIDVDPLDLM